MQSQQEYSVDKQNTVSVKEVKKREDNPEQHNLTASSNGTYNIAEAIPQDLELISYLIGNLGEEKMKGAVRAKGKCPTCEGKFQQILKIGFICPQCKTTPNKFYVDISYKGQRIRIFSDTTGQVLDTYQRAQTLLSHINHELKSHSFDPSRYVQAELQGFYVQNLLDRFRDYKLPSLAPSYQKDYKRLTSLAKGFFKTQDVRDIRRIDLINYKNYLETQFTMQGKSIKNILDLFKTFLRFCKNELEIIETVPTFPYVEIQEHSFKWLSQEDQIKLFELVEEHDKPFIAFLMLHGCRPGEARALKCKNVDLRSQTITITATFSGRVYREKRKGQRSKSVTIPIHPEMLEYVTDRINNNLPEAFLFVTSKGSYYSENKLRRIWSKIREKAGIDKTFRLYDATRHSFASQLINSGTTLFKVSKLLGHSSTKMTEKYTHQNIESLKADIKKMSLKRHVTVTKLSPAEISR